MQKGFTTFMKTERGFAPILIILLIALAVGGYFLYTKYQKPAPVPQQVVQPTIQPVATNSTETANWEIYTNPKVGFSIHYPLGWRKVETENEVGFGPKEIKEDILWNVSFYKKSGKTMSQIKNEIGNQFPDRKQNEEKITINDLIVTKVLTVTDQHPDWYSVEIIIDRGDNILIISNGAQTDSALNEMILKRTGKKASIKFEDFYRSFQFTN